MLREFSKYKVQRVREQNMVFGVRAVIEAIDAGKEIDKILIKKDANSPLIQQLKQRVADTSILVQRVPPERLNQFTDKNHQGVIAFISPVAYHNLETLVPTLYEQGRTPLLVVLDGVTDVRNFGAIARTCQCAGVDALIIPSHGGATITPDAIKTSAGALLRLPVCKVADLGKALQFLADSGITLVAATEKTQHLYTEVDFRVPAAIIMGAEDTGIAPEILKICHKQARIPICGDIESLNVSVSAGIVIYEAVRQRSAV